jgi:two-component system, NtrC family, sensor kinase
MRLALKFVLAFMLGNILLASIYGYLAVQRAVRLFAETASEETEAVGHAMEQILADAYRNDGPGGVQRLISSATARETDQMRIRWVWFDSRPGSPDSPSAPPERLTMVTIEQHLAVEDHDPDGVPALRIYWPVRLNVNRRGGLEFSHSMARLEKDEHDIIWRIVLLIGGMLLLSGLLAAVLGIRYVGRPLRQLIEKTRRVATGDLQGPVHLQTHDELAELAESLNGMCARLAESQGTIREETAARIAAMEQLRHADRLKTVGRMASGIAHELGTPLNVVAGRASLITSGKLTPEEIGLSATAIKTEADKMTKIIRQLLDFARVGTPRKVAVDLRQIVSQTVDLLRTIAEKQKVRLDFTPGNDPAVANVDTGQIQQVLMNLVVNAVQAMPQGGEVDIVIRRQSTAQPKTGGNGKSDYYGIEIRDEGVGIPDENMPHLFEPFFTTKEVGDGTGLGLSIAYGIVQEHGGWIDVASRPGEGSCFTVFLPEGPKS